LFATPSYETAFALKGSTPDLQGDRMKPFSARQVNRCVSTRSFLPCATLSITSALLVCCGLAGCSTTSEVQESSEGRIVDVRLIEKEAPGTRVLKETRLGSLDVELGKPDTLEAHLAGAFEATFDQYRDWDLAYSRELKTSGSAGECGFDLVFSPILIIGAVVGDSDNVLDSCVGSSQKLEDAKRHPDGAPVKTGVQTVRQFDEPYDGAVSLTINGAKQIELTAKAGVARIPFSDLQRLAEGAVNEVDVTAPNHPNPTSLHASLDDLRLAAINKKILAAEQAAAGAARQAAAEQAQAEEEQRQAEQRAAQSDDDDGSAAMMGMLMGAVAAKATGSADMAAQVAAAAGVDADAARLGASMAIQQEQQALAQANQLREQQQELSARIAEQRQERLAAQTAAAQARATQVAMLEEQQRQTQQRLEQQAQERATQEKAFATQCLKVRENYIEKGDPSLSIRETQHFKLQNLCAEDVWAFIIDRDGRGEGGVVASGDVREFVFFDKGSGWMKDYKGCIVKYDVDHACAGGAGGLGAY
jgi:hypothetical protein